MDGEPAVIDPGLEVVDEAVGALEPAVRNRRLTTEEQAVRSKERRDPGGGALLAAVEVKTVGRFSGVEGEPLIVEHVSSPAHSLARLCAIAVDQVLLERLLACLPIPVAESGPAVLERGHIRRALRHVYREPVTPKT